MKKVKISRHLKLLLVGVLIGGILAGGTIAVAASYPNSSWGTEWWNMVINGVTYYNQNQIYISLDNSNNRYASARIYKTKQTSGTIPTGWAGASGRLYNSKGVCVRQEDWFYSPSGAAGIGSFATVWNVPVYEMYYSQGWTRAWSGAEYWTFSSNKTLSRG